MKDASIVVFTMMIAVAIVLGPATLWTTAADEPRGPARGTIIFHEDFEKDPIQRWDFTDPAAWRVAASGKGGSKVLEQYLQSKYQPPFRSPLNIALARDTELSDFVLDVDLRSTGRDYGHRDLCIFFGHQDASHFYYVHLGKEADPHANSIFLVDGKPRVSIAESRTKGTPWTDGWHHVRIVRKVEDGLIEVFFDDMSQAAMIAHDRHFTRGRLGVGSFDDTGMFDEFTLRGKRAR